jgi:hypothetical protein
MVCRVATGACGVSVRVGCYSKVERGCRCALYRAGPWHADSVPGRLISSGKLLLENACLRIMQCDCIGRYQPSFVSYISHLHTNFADFTLTGLVVRESRVCCISKVGVAGC